MTGLSFKPTINTFTRVFTTEGGGRADRAPIYQSCVVAGPLQHALGDVTRIEAPSPTNWGGFIEIGQTRGAIERPTITLMGRYPADLRSDLKRISEGRCPIDIHINIGACVSGKPNELSSFSKRIIVEGAYPTNYATGDLGSLSSDGESEIDETVDFSAQVAYEVLPLKFTKRADDLLTNQVLDVVIADTARCGTCSDYSDGCQKIYAITSSAGGSPSTPADIVFSLNKGVTWYAHDIDTLSSSEIPSALALIGNYIVVVSNASNSLHYVNQDDIVSPGDPVFSEVSTGFVTGYEPNDMWSVGSMAFIVADGGYIYSCTSPSSGVTVLDAGVAVSDDLHGVHALSSTFAVAVGNAGSIVKTENGKIWSKVTTTPVGVGTNLTSVWLKTEREWWITAGDGTVYYTLDGGVVWTQRTLPAIAALNSVREIVFSTNNVGYIAHNKLSPSVGRILRTTDAGKTWEVMPENRGSMPEFDLSLCLAVCTQDPNFVVCGGLAANGSDGVILLGQN